MNTQMMICLLLFVFMLISFLMAKIPLGVTASIVAILLAVTHCVAAEDVLGSFGNSNTIIIASMIVLAWTGADDIAWKNHRCDSPGDKWKL